MLELSLSPLPPKVDFPPRESYSLRLMSTFKFLFVYMWYILCTCVQVQVAQRVKKGRWEHRPGGELRHLSAMRLLVTGLAPR